MNIIDGKKVSGEILEELKNTIKANNLDLTLGIIWVGNDEGSKIYINNKIKRCDSIGIKTKLYHLESETSEKELLDLIDSLNNDSLINGIILQSPVPSHIDIIKCFNSINPNKDVDGFSNVSVGNNYQNRPSIIPCTPKGIMKLFDYYNIDLKGKNVCIINRSNIVGKPLLPLLLERDATVNVCHSKTKDLAFWTRNADIIISAIGKPKIITAEMIKDGAIIIDVGISRIDGKISGDVDFENVKEKVSYITPVPGGVGPMTVAMLLDNLVEISMR